MPFKNSIVLFCTQNKRTSSTSACSSSVYNFLHYDLICPMSDAVHLSHPRRLVDGFELFRDAFLFGVFFYQPRKELLCLFFGIGKVGMERSGSKKIVIQNFVVLLQISEPTLSPNTDRAFFFGW